LFFGLWLLSHIFPFIWHLEHGGHDSSEHFFEDPDYPGALKVFLGISMAIMASSLLCFTALLITTRLIFPNGKFAIYLVQEQKRIISV
jgi:signal transduction histidine kinase